MDNPDPSHNGGGQPGKHGEFGNGQNMNSLVGKILRIDVNQQPYGIPNDNPFVGKETADGQSARPAIYAYGFRNPWRISFDRKTGRLFAIDMGRIRLKKLT